MQLEPTIQPFLEQLRALPFVTDLDFSAEGRRNDREVAVTTGRSTASSKSVPPKEHIASSSNRKGLISTAEYSTH
jgi:hypothetical protein